MKQKIPKTPFATRLSGDAKETELRIRSIFQWKQKRPPFLLFTLIVMTILGCGGVVSCHYEAKEANVPPNIERAELINLTLDSDGIGDDAAYLESEINMSDWDASSTILRVVLGNGDELTRVWEETRAYPALTAAWLTDPNKSSLVVGLADVTSTYGAETIYVFDVVNGQLVERLHHDGVEGTSVQPCGNGLLDSLNLAQSVNKWNQPDFYPAAWDGERFRVIDDGVAMFEYPLKEYGAVGNQGELALHLKISTATELLTCEEVQVLRGEEIIQTITPEKYEVFYGRSQVAMTPMQFDDVNFDGYLDFGILCEQSANAYHDWYVWEPERLNFRFFGTLGAKLTVDDTIWQIIETLDDGKVVHYDVSQSGKLIGLLTPEKENPRFDGQTAAFQSVLRQSSLVYDATDGNRERKIVYTMDGNTFAPAYFSVVDLEHDEVPEVVLWMSLGGNYYVGYDILRWEEGTVVSYSEAYRGFQGLKEDGTFSYSSGAFDRGVGLCAGFGESGLNMTNLTWRSGEEYFVNSRPASANQFNSALAAQDEKPDVVWYEYTNESIRKLGGIIAAAVG